MSNPTGIDYESMILNAREEQAVEELSKVIMEFGQPNHGDMKNDPVMELLSVSDFVSYWQGVFPNIGKEVMVSAENVTSKNWGSLTSLGMLRGGIDFLQNKYLEDSSEEGVPKSIPPQVQNAIEGFYEVLVDEANEVGSGSQKFVDERNESEQS